MIVIRWIIQGMILTACVLFIGMFLFGCTTPTDPEVPALQVNWVEGPDQFRIQANGEAHGEQ